VRWHTDGPAPYPGVWPVEGRYDWLSALVEGARRYPELGVLLPARPASADCSRACGSMPTRCSRRWGRSRSGSARVVGTWRSYKLNCGNFGEWKGAKQIDDSDTPTRDLRPGEVARPC
jgi:hypothetical protein